MEHDKTASGLEWQKDEITAAYHRCLLVQCAKNRTLGTCRYIVEMSHMIHVVASDSYKKWDGLEVERSAAG